MSFYATVDLQSMIKNYVKNKKIRAALSIESDMMQRVPEVIFIVKNFITVKGLFTLLCCVTSCTVGTKASA